MLIRSAKLLVILGAVGIAGCAAKDETNATAVTKPFKDQGVNLIVPKSLNLPSLWEVMIQEWSSQSGATPRFTEYNADETIQPDSLPATASVLLCPLSQLCEIDSKLESLNAIQEIDSRDLFKGLRERVCSREQMLVAYPVSVPVLVCYFRSDLLKAAQRRPPETWDEYEELVTSVNQWAPGLVAIEPLSSEFRATTFFARSLAYCKHPENYSVWFDVDTAKPVLNTPGFIKALEVTQRIWQRLPSESHNYSPADCRRLMLSGNAAITLSFETGRPGASFLETNEESTAIQRVDGIEIGICPLPGSRTVYNRNSKKWDTLPGKAINAPALCGFAGLAMGILQTGEKKSESAAANLLATLCSSEMFDQAFATLPKGPCRESQMIQASSWFGPELSSDESSQYCDAVSRSLREKQIVLELPLSGSREFRDAASSALEPLLQRQSNHEQAIEAMQNSFEAIVERRGPESVRDSHRRGLGMTAVMKKSALGKPLKAD